MVPFETYYAKTRGTADTFSENRMILASVILSQYTRVTDDVQTTDRHIMTTEERSAEWKVHAEYLSERLDFDTR